MTKEQQQVKDFMVLAQQTTPSKPTWVSWEVNDLRIRLIQEELQELCQSINIVEAADAIADLLYVVYGTAVAYGIDIDPIFQEVHRSNMSKFIDGFRREDGKWVKGPSYSPANLEPILEKQGNFYCL